MRSSTSNPTIDSLEGDGELRVEEGRDSIWFGCQKAPHSAPSGGQKGREKRLQSNRRDMRHYKVALGPGHEKERRSQSEVGNYHLAKHPFASVPVSKVASCLSTLVQ